MPMSIVAMQAQGFRPPKKSAPPINPSPKDISIIQDPSMMSANEVYSQYANRRPLKEIRSNIIAD
jgi:hypothetical protein